MRRPRFMGPREGQKSISHKSEELFCDEIEKLLIEMRIEHRREYVCNETESRVDFNIDEFGVFLEAKIDLSGTCFDRAIGQAFRYKHLEKRNVWFVLPDDIKLTDDQRTLIAIADARPVPLSDLPLALIQGCEHSTQSYMEWFRGENRGNPMHSVYERHCVRTQNTLSKRIRDEREGIQPKTLHETLVDRVKASEAAKERGLEAGV